VTCEVANAIIAHQQEEERALMASRTSSVQRMDEKLGVPLNLFELLKGDTSEYPVKVLYFLELEHRLMGFFPAIVEKEDRVVITTDAKLLLRVWRMMEPRFSGIRAIDGYVSSTHGVAYQIDGTLASDREASAPQKILTQAEFEELTREGGSPFGWARGLFGGTHPSREQFLHNIEVVAREHDVEISAGQ